MAVGKCFVLVHGTSCGGWIWQRVAPLLRARGHDVFTPTLTGMGERSHLGAEKVDYDTHLKDIPASVDLGTYPSVAKGSPCHPRLGALNAASRVAVFGAVRTREGQPSASGLLGASPRRPGPQREQSPHAPRLLATNSKQPCRSTYSSALGSATAPRTMWTVMWSP